MSPDPEPPQRFALPTEPRQFSILPQHRVIHGVGAARALAEQVDQVGGRRVLVVTGRTLAHKTEVVSGLERALGARWAATFSECDQHVPRPAVLAGAEVAREHGVDCLVSVGGGTPIDTAKGIALALDHDIRAADQFDRHRLDYSYGEEGDEEEPPPTEAPRSLPHVAVPTTISGGEYSHGFTIKNPATGRKDVFIADGYVPDAVILDPEVTLPTPPWLWSATGIRSVDHCVEGFLSHAAHPLTSALATSALPVLMSALAATKDDPSDLGARLDAQVASWMSIFQVIPNVRFGLSHGLGHQVGGRFDIPHGVTSCIFLPRVLRFNAAVPEAAAQQAVLARTCGIAPAAADDATAAAVLADRIAALVDELELPSTLRHYDVPQEDFGLVAEDVLSDFIVETNPRRIGSADEVIELLRSAW